MPVPVGSQRRAGAWCAVAGIAARGCRTAAGAAGGTTRARNWVMSSRATGGVDAGAATGCGDAVLVTSAAVATAWPPPLAAMAVLPIAATAAMAAIWTMAGGTTVR